MIGTYAALEILIIACEYNAIPLVLRPFSRRTGWYLTGYGIPHRNVEMGKYGR